MAVLTKITSRSLADNAVSSAKIQDGAIAVADVADGSITANKLATDAVTTVKIANDAVTAAKIPAGAVVADVGTGGITATQLATDAVTTVKIANDAVDADKLASNAVVTASIVDANITAVKIGTAAVTSAKMGDVIEVKPHIKYGMLYPALKDAAGTVRLSDGVTAINASATGGPAGSTIAASAYGTVQSDGRMYYYTDIKGSKPIKDPRIGAHFGSQRHKAKSIQILEEETATYGKFVHSVDGRGWCRVVSGDNNVAWISKNDNGGNFLQLGDPPTGGFIEITGYFNDINMLMNQDSDAVNDVDLFVNGTVAQAGNTTIGGDALAYSPLRNRYVDKCCLIHGGATLSTALGTTPTINTLKILATNAGGEYFLFSGFELIAQDTTSVTTRDQVQILPQNVVSYGKRFAVGVTQSATATDKKALHYNPFAFKTDGTTAWASGAHNGTGWPTGLNSAHNIDTATSLGLNKWLHSSNYYKPYNGGRVVIWVDSSGNIKTSVNVMPPNARSMNTGALNTPKANASVANNNYLPTFETGAVDDFPTTALTEVAKTFHWREFGNGAANGGTNASTWADASMVTSTNDNIAYVMDDGLTSLNAVTWQGSISGTHNGALFAGATTPCYITFIGTGIAINFSSPNDTRITIAQNLPYGTHILKILYDTSGSNDLFIDGTQVEAAGADTIVRIKNDITFYQPKMPPIPEDAVILSDYMLMADIVQIPNATAALDGHISKGMLRKDISRDYLIQPNSGSNVASLSVNPSLDSGFLLQNSTGQVLGIDLPHFGTKFMVSGESAGSGHWSSIYGGTAVSQTQIDNTSVSNGMDKFSGPSTAKNLGINTLQLSVNSGYGSRCVDFNTPIHTSSHYQTFEDMFLKTLMGGDRNMEQTNLVVTPDGKTWDEVTRDVSYMGAEIHRWAWITGHFNTQNLVSANLQISDSSHPWQCRGLIYGRDYGNKNFALAYDRHICLKDGVYEICASSYHTTN